MDSQYSDHRALLRMVARSCKVTEKEVVDALAAEAKRNMKREVPSWQRRKKL